LELINPQQSADQAVSCQLCVPKDKIPRFEPKDMVVDVVEESRPIDESRSIEKKPGRRCGRREQLLELINPQTSPDQKVSCQLCVIKHKVVITDEPFEDEISVASESGSVSQNSTSGVQSPHQTESVPPSSDEDEPVRADRHQGEQASGVFTISPPTLSARAAETGRIQERGRSDAACGPYQDLDSLVWVGASRADRGEAAGLPPMQGRLRAVLPTLLRPVQRRPDSSASPVAAGPATQAIVRRASLPRANLNV